MKKGFTLVELLVVIAVIMLLVALILPVMTSVRIQAKTAVCLSNMRQVGLGVQAYTLDNRGHLPGNYFVPLPTWYCWTYEDIMQTPQTGSVFPYVNNYKVYVCPLDIKGNGRLSYSSPTILGNKPYGQLKEPAEAIFLIHEAAEQFINNGHREGGFANIDKGSTVHAGKVTLLYCDWHAVTWWQKKDFYAKDIYIEPYGWNQ
ncbi:type II secretion system protein [Planctomycetota bacterium]